jgi:hypothetical protein
MNRLEAEMMRGKPVMTPSEKLRRKPTDEAHKQDKAVLFREQAHEAQARRVADLAGRK